MKYTVCNYSGMLEGLRYSFLYIKVLKLLPDRGCIDYYDEATIYAEKIKISPTKENIKEFRI